MSKCKKAVYFVVYMLISLLVLVTSLGISLLLRQMLINRAGLTMDEASIVAGLVQCVVASVAAGLVLLQLRTGDDLTRRQTSVEKAQFILEYNRSFIENRYMTEMERYMECLYTGVDRGEVSNLSVHRQDMINYLVYLEGLASCVEQGVLDFDSIDELFAYRFFISMNHPEIQSIDLLPYATYYRGCFKLYDKWLSYRMKSSKHSEENHWGIPLFESALCNHYGYERYATPEISIRQNEKKPHFVAFVSNRQRGELWVEDNKVMVKVSAQGYMKEKILRALLKELLYHEVFRNTFKSMKEYWDWIDNIKINSEEKNSLEYAIFGELRKAQKCLFEEGPHFRQLNNRIKLTTGNRERIATLIYETDKAIYSHMFGNEDNAKKVIAKLLNSGKDNMFNLQNIYVCELNEEIVGLILWHAGKLHWSTKEIRYTMKEEKVGIPSTLDNVANEYIAGYSAVSRSDSVSIINLCVNRYYQKCGIGKKMLMSFLSEHPESQFDLCVLSDNEIAINLYSQCGFMKYDEEPAYPRTSGKNRSLMRRGRV